MNYQPKHTLALVLFRTDYAESDRIVTFLTKDFGKLRAIANGARKERGKLAAGVELFGISEIGFIVGRGELATLISARLVKNYHHFLGDLNKVDFGFKALKRLNKIIAENADNQYFLLAEKLLTALDATDICLDITALWWYVNLAQLTGHGLNLRNAIDGQDYGADKKYIFDQERGGFIANPDGNFKPNHIKLLRLASEHLPQTLVKIKDAYQLASELNVCMLGFVDYHH